MATMITEECIACGACEDMCPNEAIALDDEAELFVIAPDLCTECIGHDAEQQCAAACPPEVCVANPDQQESEAELFEKLKLIWPEQADSFILDETTSHFRA